MKEKLYSVFWVLMLSLGVSNAATYYVATTGSDSNNGSISSPFATTQKAIDVCTSGNDIIYLRGGIYHQTTNIHNKSGITITEYSGETAVLDGTGTRFQNFFKIYSCNNLTITELTMQNLGIGFARGIYVWDSVAPASTNLTFSNNIFTQINCTSTKYAPGYNTTIGAGSNAILVAGGLNNPAQATSNVTITGNLVSQCEVGFSEGITVKGNINGFLIANNTVQDVSNIGIDAAGLMSWPVLSDITCTARNGVIRNNTAVNCVNSYSTNGAIYVDGGNTIQILYNTVYNNKFGINVGVENQMSYVGGNTYAVEVRDNLIYNNSLSGLLMGTSGSGTLGGMVLNCTVAGNTFIKNGTSANYELFLQNMDNVSISNNIFYMLPNQQYLGYLNSGVSGLTLDYNIYYNASSNPTSIYLGGVLLSTYGSHSLFVDPLLTNASSTNPNAILQSGSPAANAANPSFTALPGETDYYGSTRIQSGRMDIGCAESGTAYVAVTSVSVNPTSATVAIGTTRQLTATVSPSNATNKNITWSTSNPSVATVSASGLVTSVSVGNATITVTSADQGRTATCAVTVATVAVTGVTVSPSSVSLSTASTQQLIAIIAPVDATNKNVTWSSNNTSIATVSSTGLVTAVAPGSATITVTTVDGNRTATCAVTVLYPVTGVSVSPTSATLSIGGTQQLTATVVPSNAGNKNVTWSSSNTAIATVNSTGLVTGVAVGNALITVTTVDKGFTAACVVSVGTSGINVVVDGSLSDWSSIGAIATATGQTSLSLKAFDNASFMYFGIAGSGMDATNYHIFLNTDNNTATGFQDATFTSSGADYMVENGQLFRSTGTGWGWTLVFDITASKNTSVTEVQIPRSSLGTLSSTIQVAYTDLNSGFAVVSKLGYASYIPGNATSVPVTGVTMSPTTASIIVGGTQQLTATVAPTNATNKNVTWSSNNTSVATVNSSGLVTGIAAGSATITVTTVDGNRTATCAVTVTTSTVPVTGVTVSPTTASLSVGGTQQLTATVAPTNATNKNVTWSSNNTSVATVNSLGLVTAVAAGSATITVTTVDQSRTATCAVTVTTGTIPALTAYYCDVDAMSSALPMTITGNLNSKVVATAAQYSAIANSDNSRWTSPNPGTGDEVFLWLESSVTATGITSIDLSFEGYLSGASANFSIWVRDVTNSIWVQMGTTQSIATGADGTLTRNITTNISNYISGGKLIWGVYESTSSQPLNIDRVSIVVNTGTTIPVTGVTMSPTTASITAGGTQQLTATVAPSNATNINVTWSSSNTSVATVNATGLVTAVAAGSATITVTTVDGAKTATCAITVTSGGGGGVTIIIDGSLSDWSSVSAIATATGQTCTSLKVYDDVTYFYFGIAGSGMNATNYQIFLNTDNNTATGYQDASFASGSGAEYLIENGGLFQSTGTGWSWTAVSTTVTASKNTSFTEVRVPRSALGTLSSSIQVAYKDINDSWAVVSQLGYSSYTKLKIADEGSLTNNISVYPNPVSEILYIDLGNSNSSSIVSIYNLEGRLIYKEETTENKIGINTNELNLKGVLIVHLYSGQNYKTFKIKAL